VFVRELSPQVGERLRRMSKRAKHFVTRQRASILPVSATRYTVPQIASTWQADESCVREVIHEFNVRRLHPGRAAAGRPVAHAMAVLQDLLRLELARLAVASGSSTVSSPPRGGALRAIDVATRTHRVRTRRLGPRRLRGDFPRAQPLTT
jgi:hypothetical protein